MMNAYLAVSVRISLSFSQQQQQHLHTQQQQQREKTSYLITEHVPFLFFGGHVREVPESLLMLLCIGSDREDDDDDINFSFSTKGFLSAVPSPLSTITSDIVLRGPDCESNGSIIISFASSCRILILLLLLLLLLWQLMCFQCKDATVELVVVL